MTLLLKCFQTLSVVLFIKCALMPSGRARWPLIIVIALVALPFCFEVLYVRFALSSDDKKSSSSSSSSSHKKEKDDKDGNDDDVIASTKVAGSVMGTKSIDKTEKELIVVDKKLLKRPRIAWLTIALAFATFTVWFLSMYLYCQERITARMSFALSTISTFVAFTPMHDAVHFAVAPAYPWLNEFIGQICGMTLFAPVSFFRYSLLLIS